MTDGDERQQVIVTDVRMPFGSMVVFMVKWAIAAIPAFMILAFIWAMVFAIVTSNWKSGFYHY
jgi:hypothetical protein